MTASSPSLMTTRDLGPAPEREVARDIAIRGLKVLPVALVLGFIGWGVNGVISVGLAVAMVLVNFLVAAALLSWAARISLGLLMGVGLIIFSVGSAATQRAKDLPVDLVGSKPINFTYDVNSLHKKTANPTAPTGESLVETLRALEQSYEEGLINKDEYDDARKRILDKL